VVNFNFTPSPNIQLNQTSALLLINTDATRFTAGTIPISDGVTATGVGFAPASVPEPSAVVLSLIGLVPLGLAFRKRLSARA
jgi:hypothetical protein